MDQKNLERGWATGGRFFQDGTILPGGRTASEKKCRPVLGWSLILMRAYVSSRFPAIIPRVRENLCNTLTRKFIDEMKAYQNSQQKYKTDIKKKVARQVQIVKPDATEEEIDAVMKSEGGRDALYREQILAGGVNDQVKTTYAKVAGKYQDVLALESSVAELHQMFLDFALLTEQQGELLDQIEFQVKQAGDYVEDANVDVYESIEYQKKIRKKQCWIILIVVVAIIVILFATRIIKV